MQPDDAAAIKAAERAKGPRGKVAWLDSFFEFLSDSFRPILGALLGASLFITFMALMATLDVIPHWNAPGVTLEPSWAFINLMLAVRVRLPAVDGRLQRFEEGRRRPVGRVSRSWPCSCCPGSPPARTSAQTRMVFGSEVDIVAHLRCPADAVRLQLAGVPAAADGRRARAAVQGLKRLIPANVQLIFVPFFAMLIMIPLTAFIIGPIGVYAGAGLGASA